MNDRRSSPRQRSFLKGRILFNGGQSSFECLIRDLSSGGARLEMSGSITLPERFDLFLPHRNETCRVQIQWRRDDQLGVAFETAGTVPSGPPLAEDLGVRVRQLETEIDMMRTLLVQMRFEVDALKTGRDAA